MWDAITGIVAEIKTAERAGATTAALAMSYVLMDTMTFLSLPAEKGSQGKQDFIDWVNTYLQGHADQPYKYDGLDVYGARCALLHVYGVQSSFHDDHPEAKTFAYHDGGKHATDEATGARLVLIGSKSFINDVLLAVQSFLKKCQEDKDLKSRAEGRLPGVLKTLAIGDAPQ